MELLNKYREYKEKIKAYSTAIGMMSFDMSTVAPNAGKSYNGKLMSILAGEVYDIQTCDEFKNIVKELSCMDLPFDIASEVKYDVESIRKVDCIDKQLFMEYQEVLNNAQTVWEDAKSKADYKIFEPTLLKIIDLTKKVIACRNDNVSLYDSLLDDYESGMTMKQYDEFFDLVKSRLVPLIHKINAKKDFIDNKKLMINIDTCKQASFMKLLNEYLGFNPEWGYMSESVHPFTCGFSRNDIRITTKYVNDDITSSIYSVIHEVGHATYEHQVALVDNGREIDNMISSGMHESQSRLFENYLGRRKSFWNYHIDGLTKICDELKDLNVDYIYKAVNKAGSSLIRTDADELTYPIHILIRYTIEKGIFDGTIDLNNLENVWNRLYEEFLGVTPTDASVGILQDVHWSGGSFGYFPTYALGSAFAAQFMNQMEKEINVDEALETNNFSIINEWLKTHIHKYGGSKNANEIIEEVCHEKFDPNYYIDYLIKKYTDLYEVTND